MVTWSALSSTSPDMEATKAFLAKGSKSENATGTLFIIEKGWGYDIQPYSLFPDEEEILLELERQFRVACVIQVESLTSRCWTRRYQSPKCLGVVVGADGKGTKHNFLLFPLFQLFPEMMDLKS